MSETSKKGIFELFYHSKIENQFISQAPRYIILDERILLAVIFFKICSENPLQKTTGR